MIMNTKPKIGVYICHCGGNISDTVDMERVKESIATLDGVKIAETNEYVCSSPGQDMIKNGIKDHKLNRIIVASCSPRMHLETFKRTVSEAGLNPYLFEMVNIREQDSWVHDNIDQATEKAIDLIRGAVNRAIHLKELKSKKIDVTRSVLVIGGGIAGISASIEIADKGYEVYLVEKSPSLGGHMAQLSKTFPTLDCSACVLAPKMVYVAQHPNIKILSLTEPIAVSGSPGNYEVTLKKHPRYVDEDKCTSCGECAKVCPVRVPSKFDEGLTQERSVYLPFKQAIPNTYVLDKENCLFFTRGVCKLCERFCKGNAIAFDQVEETIKLNVGAIIVSTGYKQLEMDILGQYNFGKHPNIVTNLQFERIAIQGFGRPSDGKPPKKVAFILCAGSRDTEKGVPYCCKIGCMNAIKEAILLDKAVTNAEPWIFYTDIRAHGKGYEEFYEFARDHKVNFVRGRVADIIPLNSEKILVRAEDTLLGTRVQEVFDLVVLQSAIIPQSGTQELARILGIPIGSDGFFLERHHKLRPVDTTREGIYLCGCAMGPKDIRETTLEAMGTASKVATFIGKGEFNTSPEIAYIISEKCNLCEECIKVCPVGAIERTEDMVMINPVTCVGCGICVPKCPEATIDLNHSTEAQLIDQIRGISQGGTEPKIIAFFEKDTAYASIDAAGQTRLSYSPNIRIIRIPSAGRISLKHILHAFAAGADGIMFIEGTDSVLTEDKLRQHVIDLKKNLRPYGIKSLRLVSTTTTIPQYNKILNLFETFTKRITTMGKVPDEVRQKIESEIHKGTTLKVETKTGRR
jgi:heterodisulfide reductase subunit A